MRLGIERDPLRRIVGGFSDVDVVEKIEAIAHTDPFSVGVLTGEISRQGPGSDLLKKPRGRRRLFKFDF